MSSFEKRGFHDQAHGAPNTNESAARYNAAHSDFATEFQAETGVDHSDIRSIEEWQREHHLNADGKIGRDTLGKVHRRSKTPTRPRRHTNERGHPGELTGKRGTLSSSGDASQHGNASALGGTDACDVEDEGWQNKAAGLFGHYAEENDVVAAAPAACDGSGDLELSDEPAPAVTGRESHSPSPTIALGDANGPAHQAAPGRSNGDTARPILEHAPAGSGPGAIEDRGVTRTEEVLRADEIFQDVGKNTVAKKQAFSALSEAVKRRQRAQASVNPAAAGEARAAADKELATANAQVEAATEHLKEFIVDARLPSDPTLKDLRAQLNDAKKHNDGERAATIDAALRGEIEQARARIRAEVDVMKHSDEGHEGESVFEPERTEVSSHDFVFQDGEHVKLRDHVVAYATTAPLGVDSDSSETKADKQKSHGEVEERMQQSDLSSSDAKILKAISGFEGGFSSINTYDKAGVTWGFVQWTGGSHSDLTKALTIIKKEYPDAFARSFQAYGIDVEKDQLVITQPDGQGQVVGKEAAEALMKNPRLAAALSHAGRDTDVQKGEVKAADTLEIGAALAMKVSVQKHELTPAALVTSEYGVGLLANTFVHSGGGEARKLVESGLAPHVAKLGFAPDDAAWAAGAESCIVAAVAAHDSDRAAQLAKLLNKERGTYKP